jgi:hypothetical protein
MACPNVASECQITLVFQGTLCTSRYQYHTRSCNKNSCSKTCHPIYRAGMPILSRVVDMSVAYLVFESFDRHKTKGVVLKTSVEDNGLHDDTAISSYAAV